jgi:flavin reductase (DIM6/NTAB) family NADH-FMN oxidoreductase RutF
VLNTSTSANLFVEAEMATEKREGIGKALGRVASGVYVVTVVDEGQPSGMLATWVSQTSFKPPMVSLAVNKERGILNAVKVGSGLTINILGKENHDIFKAFAKPHQENLNRFEGIKLSASHNGCAAFADAVAYLECVVESLVDAGDHCLAVARITGGALQHADAEPMVHLRKNGFQY